MGKNYECEFMFCDKTIDFTKQDEVFNEANIRLIMIMGFGHDNSYPKFTPQNPM